MGLVKMEPSNEEAVTTRDQVFDCIVQYKRDHDGNSPSLREIADACFLSHPSTVQYHLTHLEIENRIHISGDKRRHIEIVGASWDYAEAKSNLQGPDESQSDLAGHGFPFQNA